MFVNEVHLHWNGMNTKALGSLLLSSFMLGWLTFLLFLLPRCCWVRRSYFSTFPQYNSDALNYRRWSGSQRSWHEGQSKSRHSFHQSTPRGTVRRLTRAHQGEEDSHLQNSRLQLKLDSRRLLAAESGDSNLEGKRWGWCVVLTLVLWP